MITSLPNLLTLSRIFVIPGLIAAFYLESLTGGVIDQVTSNWITFGIFAFAGITDFFDGYLARIRNEQSVLGQFLDPVADKLLVAAVLMLLVAGQRIADWSILAAIVILCREIMVSGLREFLAEIRVGMPVSKLAKWKTTVQILSLGFLLTGVAGDMILPIGWTETTGIILLWIAAALTMWTGYDYLRLGLHHMTDDLSGGASETKPNDES